MVLLSVVRNGIHDRTLGGSLCYYLIVKFYMFYNVFFYFQLFLGFWLSSVILPGDILPCIILPGVFFLDTFDLYCD